MTDIEEEKRDKFSAAINHYAEEQRRQIENEIAEYKNKKLEETEKQVLLECYRMIQKKIAQMRNKISQEMSKRAMNARRELLKRRSQITSEVFAKAIDNLNAFTGTDGYAAFLKKAAQEFGKLFAEPGIVIYMRKQDENYKDAVRSALGYDCIFQVDNTIKIGGIKASHPKRDILADETLDTLLTDQYQWFEANSGLANV
ncbi:MAG TPA: hypothetical protein DG942_02940 [Ruminococcaceae bacterium]|jgi:V/A-type H+-transporting ATPase subunit E|nr:hypothetical protein [Oscillospiraceae bacterium]